MPRPASNRTVVLAAMTPKREYSVTELEAATGLSAKKTHNVLASSPEVTSWVVARKSRSSSMRVYVFGLSGEEIDAREGKLAARRTMKARASEVDAEPAPSGPFTCTARASEVTLGQCYDFYVDGNSGFKRAAKSPCLKCAIGARVRRDVAGDLCPS